MHHFGIAEFSLRNVQKLMNKGWDGLDVEMKGNENSAAKSTKMKRFLAAFWQQER